MARKKGSTKKRGIWFIIPKLKPLSGPPCKDDVVRYRTVPLQALSDQAWMKLYVCIDINVYNFVNWLFNCGFSNNKRPVRISTVGKRIGIIRWRFQGFCWELDHTWNYVYNPFNLEKLNNCVNIFRFLFTGLKFHALNLPRNMNIYYSVGTKITLILYSHLWNLMAQTIDFSAKFIIWNILGKWH